MVVSIIIALLAYFLASAVPIISPGLVSFFIWCVILYVLAGVGYHQMNPGQNRWFF